MHERYRRTVAPVQVLPSLHHVEVQEHFLGFARDHARVEACGVFTEQKEDLGKAFLESGGGPDNSDGAPQLARGVFEIAELGIGE